MKYYIKKDENNFHKCTEPCPFKNEGKSETDALFFGVRIGSGYCQGCEHHKNNNLKETYGPDYSINRYGGLLRWIECDKLVK